MLPRKPVGEMPRLPACRAILALLLLAAVSLSGCGADSTAGAYIQDAQVAAEHARFDLTRHNRRVANWWAKRSEMWLQKSTGVATKSASQGGVLATFEDVGSLGLSVARVWSVLKYVLLALGA